MRSWWRSVRQRAVVLACLAHAGCATRPPPPSTTVPTNLGPLPRAEQGQGVIVVDVTDGPSTVRSPDSHQACTTPCALVLPLGSRPLLLRYRDASGDEDLDRTTALVLPEPQVLRRTLQRVVIEKPVRRTVALSAYIAGGVALAASLVVWPFADRGDAAQGAARGLAAGGGGLFLLSFPLAVGTARRSTGSEVQFPLQAAPGHP